jgi:hypothetical protein
VHEFDTPEYNALIPLNKRQPGSRSVIMLHVHKASSVHILSLLSLELNLTNWLK